MKFVYLLCGLFLTGCGVFQQNILLESEYIIFSAEQADTMNLAVFTLEPEISGYWTPSDTEIVNLTRRFDAYIQQNGIIIDLENYEAQFFGYRIGDQNLIYGNYFCNTFGRDQLTQFIVVTDGGACLTQVIYDVRTDTIVRLSQNGDG